MTEAKRRPLHIAYHYLGCAIRSDEGIQVQSYVGPFLETLSEAVETVTVVAYDPPANPTFEDGAEYLIRRPNVGFVSLGPKGSFRDLFQRRRFVARALTSVSASWDVLVLRVPHRRMMVVARASRCPRSAALVIATTASSPAVNRTPVSFVTRRLTRASTVWQLRGVMRRVKLAFINGEQLRHLVRTGVKVVMLHIAHRRERHAYRTSDRLGSAGGPEMLVAGRLTIEKGVVDAVDALARIRRDMPEARLHVAGEGPAVDAMLARADELGVRDAIVLHGWVPTGDDLSRLYSQMDVLLLASFAAYEGFPSVVWEALAHSVLVVTTPVGGMPEVLSHEREVLYVPPHDPAAMAEAVMRLKAEPALRSVLLENGFESARSSSLESVIERVVNAFTETWPELSRVE